jgi:hypothetical protein
MPVLHLGDVPTCSEMIVGFGPSGTFTRTALELAFPVVRAGIETLRGTAAVRAEFLRRLDVVRADRRPPAHQHRHRPQARSLDLRHAAGPERHGGRAPYPAGHMVVSGVMTVAPSICTPEQ